MDYELVSLTYGLFGKVPIYTLICIANQQHILLHDHLTEGRVRSSTSLEKQSSAHCRVKRICQTLEDFSRNSKEMTTNFMKRVDNQTVLIDAAINLEYQTYSKPKKSKDKIIFSAKYNKNFLKLRSLINKHWHIWQSDTELQRKLKEQPFIVYKKNSQRSNSTVHSYLSPNDNEFLNYFYSYY